MSKQKEEIELLKSTLGADYIVGPETKGLTGRIIAVIRECFRKPLQKNLELDTEPVVGVLTQGTVEEYLFEPDYSYVDMKIEEGGKSRLAGLDSDGNIIPCKSKNGGYYYKKPAKEYFSGEEVFVKKKKKED